MFQPFFKKPLSDDTLKSELKLSTHLSDTPQNLANSLHVFLKKPCMKIWLLSFYALDLIAQLVMP